ncbi:Rrf2 family transcriptional regulator [candidate division FCPU426 bacterium]|nr:Rrf2 family transcriptional regulator [candidate division FCPU426 bacterium]
MKLTTRSEYSLLFLLYLLRQHAQGQVFVKLAKFAQKYNIPRKYLEQLANILRQNKYIKSKRGMKGGYALDKPKDAITVAEIIRLMDGALAPTSSTSVYFYAPTPLEKETRLWQVFKDIRDYTAQKLEEVTISQLT